MSKKRFSNKKRRICGVFAALFLIALAVLLYSADYYRADEKALQALASDTVRVERTDFGWLFDGPGDAAALVFYPGAKVEETAYAPLLHGLAENGLDVCLVKMPLRLAVFNQNAADRIIARYDYTRWYIGGHSLGGAVAANYAANRELDGVILLAAYPTKPVEEPMLLLYGSEDGVMNRDRLEEADRYGTVERLQIEGGNHAGFGNYGEQKGDQSAKIPCEEQQRLCKTAVTAWIEERN